MSYIPALSMNLIDREVDYALIVSDDDCPATLFITIMVAFFGNNRIKITINKNANITNVNDIHSQYSQAALANSRILSVFFLFCGFRFSCSSVVLSDDNNDVDDNSSVLIRLSQLAISVKCIRFVSDFVLFSDCCVAEFDCNELMIEYCSNIVSLEWASSNP
ncbi:hypothetical protein DERF_013258 [Dermatophagoides farinae]|uniref:Uncharacterized protein n=1 Tax=Dermatophagoides farinae TaxID=6954 RepID=A0A922HP46_DERFA|nr:hypothetical protein DERF_013258 [Dermatophagoides farinae]